MPTDVTYEGLFYDYYFDTGAIEPTNKLYSPSYSSAVTRDPLSHQTEYYLSVGLNSGLKESDFQRKKLNLTIVLDDSGSMGEIIPSTIMIGTANRSMPMPRRHPSPEQNPERHRISSEHPQSA